MLTERPGRVTPADGQTDADVIERSRIDPGCFEAIFDRHAEEILRYAHARLGPDLAEDVTAETFLAAFRHRDRYDTTRQVPGRRRLLLAAGAIAAATAAAIVVPAVLPGRDAGSLVTAAWAVQHNPDGTVAVTFKQARDAAGLQRYRVLGNDNPPTCTPAR